MNTQHKLYQIVFSILAINMLVIGSADNAFSQNYDAYKIGIKKSSVPIKIDGVLDEEAWKQSEVADNFHRVLPIDTG
jgi:hypothetical protein